MADKVQILARCHCGKNEFKLDVESSDLPLIATTCHCTTCRLSSGTFCSTRARLPTLFAQGIPDTLSVYRPRDGREAASRFFCKYCFTHMFWYRPADAAEPGSWAGWSVSTSCLGNKAVDSGDKRLEDTVSVRVHQYIGDTGDGGMASWIDDEGVSKFYAGAGGDSKELVWDDIVKMEKDLKLDTEIETATKIVGGCHCGAVKVRLGREHAYDKLLGCSCGCHDCHINANNEASQQFTWADYPLIEFGKADGEWAPFPEDALQSGSTDLPKVVNGINIRESTKGVFRGACPTCGADVFYRYPKADGKRVSLAAALFSHDSEHLGSKHKGWFTWFGTDPSDVVDGRGGVLINAFLKGWPRWQEIFKPVRVLSLGRKPKPTEVFFTLLAKARPGQYRPHGTHSMEEFESTAKEHKELINIVLLGPGQSDDEATKAKAIVDEVWGKDNNVKFLRIPQDKFVPQEKIPEMSKEDMETHFNGMVSWFLERVEK